MKIYRRFISDEASTNVRLREVRNFGLDNNILSKVFVVVDGNLIGENNYTSVCFNITIFGVQTAIINYCNKGFKRTKSWDIAVLLTDDQFIDIFVKRDEMLNLGN